MRTAEDFVDACCDADRLDALLAPDFAFDAPGVALDRAGFLALLRMAESDGVGFVLESHGDEAGPTVAGSVRVGSGRAVPAWWTVRGGKVAAFRLERLPPELRHLMPSGRRSGPGLDESRPARGRGGRHEPREWGIPPPRPQEVQRED